MRRRLAMIGRFVTDWKNGATLLATVLVSLLAVQVVDGITARRDALDAATATANQAKSSQQAATRRIDRLTTTQQQLMLQVGGLVQLTGQLQAQNNALAAQIRQMGGTPVATGSDFPELFPSSSPSPAPQPRPSPSPSPRATPTTRPSAQPSPNPSPTCIRLPILGC